ncbi:MAG TPA: META domain-containing protein [Sphingomicrobium sp.]|nr:META domain-containing protein [Sphingomicrobium sp.]
MKTLALIPAALLLGACLSHPPPPAAPYRALGQEPGWTLIIDDRELTFIGQDGNQVRQSLTQPVPATAGRTYRTQRIQATISQTGCTDTMSGQVYSDRVTVIVDGRRFEGCGGEPAAPSALAGTSWRVTSVNGRATPATGDYSLRFERDTIGARFGCNHMGGSYRQTGNMIHSWNISQTLIGCPEPSATFERQGSAILGQPMTMAMAGDRMTLRNAAGALELRRSF